MKKFKLLFLLLSLIFILSGCKLAKENTEKNFIKDKLVGGLVTYNESDKDEFLENLDDVKIDIIEDGDSKYTKVEGIDGYAFLALTTKKENEDHSTSETIGNPYINVNGNYQMFDDEDEVYINTVAEIYVDSNIDGSLRLYPIYMTNKGKYYIKDGGPSMGLGQYEDNSLILEEGDGGMITHSEATTKNYNNEKDIEEEKKNSVSIKAKKIFKGKEMKFVEMDKANRELGKQEFINENIPEKIKVNSQTEYILIEEFIKDDLIKRDIWNLDEERNFLLPVFNEGNIAEIKYIEIEKDA